MNYYIFIATIIIGFFLYKYFNTLHSNNHFIINTLIRGCSRWAIASKQDNSPLISLLHANYASGYLWAIKDVFSSEDIYNSSGVNIIELQNKITSIQDQATKKVSLICPTFAKDILSEPNLAKLAGDV